MRRVLLVTYPFFPFYHIGVKRVAKLCKYLPRAGWEPIVLTKDWEAHLAPEDAFFPPFREPERQADVGYDLEVRRAPYATRDNAALRLHRRLQTVPGGAPVALRAGAAGIRKALSLAYPLFGDFPDRYAGWIPHARRVGAASVRDRGVQAIVSVCPPATAHAAAAHVAADTGVPWVAMFDDLFGFYVGEHDSHGTALRRRQALALQRRWLRHASAVTAITPAMLRYLDRTYHRSGEVVVVGFDPEERPPVPAAAGRELGGGRRMRIVYTGSVYLGDYRPELFFDGLDLLAERVPEASALIEVCFAGTRCDDELRAMVRGRPAEHMCRFVGRVPAAEALAMQRSADALLLFNLTNPAAAQGTLSFPAKMWEYLDAGRPILAVPSDVGGYGEHVLARTGAGLSRSSATDVAELLESWLTEWRSTGAVGYRGDPSRVDEYSQPRQAEILAALLDRVSGAATRTPGELA